jgi:hypothetical protein
MIFFKNPGKRALKIDFKIFVLPNSRNFKFYSKAELDYKSDNSPLLKLSRRMFQPLSGRMNFCETPRKRALKIDFKIFVLPNSRNFKSYSKAELQYKSDNSPLLKLSRRNFKPIARRMNFCENPRKRALKIDFKILILPNSLKF